MGEPTCTCKNEKEWITIWFTFIQRMYIRCSDYGPLERVLVLV